MNVVLLISGSLHPLGQKRAAVAAYAQAAYDILYLPQVLRAATGIHHLILRQGHERPRYSMLFILSK
ncbi:hypothetical protein [Paenibacillus illinoisensis]|uniref:hypothetical protein n=1 Tax=Paenibacillus illinoisensis TaxID=59845 RepID=UPI0036F2585F